MGKDIPGRGSGLVSKDKETEKQTVRKPVWQKHKLCGRHVLAKVEEVRLENLQ